VPGIVSAWLLKQRIVAPAYIHRLAITPDELAAAAPCSHRVLATSIERQHRPSPFHPYSGDFAGVTNHHSELVSRKLGYKMQYYVY